MLSLFCSLIHYLFIDGAWRLPGHWSPCEKLNFMLFTGTFLSFCPQHLQLMNYEYMWVYVRVHTAGLDSGRPSRLPSPLSAVVSSGQHGEISSPSTAMATACKSPWASCMLQRPFTVQGWLLMSPGECQNKTEVDTHSADYSDQKHDS